MYDSETGSRLRPGDDARYVSTFHVVAQRPVAGHPAAGRPGEAVSARLHLAGASR